MEDFASNAHELAGTGEAISGGLYYGRRRGAANDFRNTQSQPRISSRYRIYGTWVDDARAGSASRVDQEAEGTVWLAEKGLSAILALLRIALHLTLARGHR
jgi:hypothetical protein